MASVAKRPDGRWRARYGDAADKEHSRHLARKLDAQRWLDEVATSVVTGQYVAPKAGRLTFGRPRVGSRDGPHQRQQRPGSAAGGSQGPGHRQ